MYTTCTLGAIIKITESSRSQRSVIPFRDRSLVPYKHIIMGGKNEKEILDAIEKQVSINIVRQYGVLGFYLDGYCKETNTAYEVDEKRHFDSEGCLIQRDVERESEIIEHLKCTFIRVTDV